MASLQRRNKKLTTQVGMSLDLGNLNQSTNDVMEKYNCVRNTANSSKWPCLLFNITRKLTARSRELKKLEIKFMLHPGPQNQLLYSSWKLEKINKEPE
jgi:hypothetical protein